MLAVGVVANQARPIHKVSKFCEICKPRLVKATAQKVYDKSLKGAEFIKRSRPRFKTAKAKVACGNLCKGAAPAKIKMDTDKIKIYGTHVKIASFKAMSVIDQ